MNFQTSNRKDNSEVVPRDGTFDDDMPAILEDAERWPSEPPTFTSATSNLTSNGFSLPCSGEAQKRHGTYSFTSAHMGTNSQVLSTEKSGTMSSPCKVRRMSGEVTNTPRNQRSDMVEGKNTSNPMSGSGGISTPCTFTRNPPPPTPESEVTTQDKSHALVNLVLSSL